MMHPQPFLPQAQVRFSPTPQHPSSENPDHGFQSQSRDHQEDQRLWRGASQTLDRSSAESSIGVKAEHGDPNTTPMKQFEKELA